MDATNPIYFLEEISKIRARGLERRLKFNSENPSLDFERELLRNSRLEKVVKIRTKLSAVIPPLFKDAHLRDFSKPFKELLKTRKQNQGLYLWGAAGTGKSHCMAALARKCSLQNKRCCRITFENLCLEIRDTYKPNSQKSEHEVIKPFIDCDILIIEDVGTSRSIGQSESDFNLRAFFVLLDSRLEACKPIFITSNKSPENLGQSFDDRIFSRLHDLKIIEMRGSDKRLRKEHER